VKAAQGGRVLDVRADDPLRAVALLKTVMEPWRVSLFGERFHVIVEGDVQAAARELTARLAADGIHVHEMRDEDYTLEDVFLAIVEKGAIAVA
jgi:ABC-2 type transport system ATP-binding protein